MSSVRRRLDHPLLHCFGHPWRGGDPLAPAVLQPVALATDVDHHDVAESVINCCGCQDGMYELRTSPSVEMLATGRWSPHTRRLPGRACLPRL